MLTPYEAAKRVNVELDKHNLKRIPSQMMYNYTYAKLAKSEKPIIKCSRESGIDEQDFARWLHNYLVKKGVVSEVSDPEQETFDLAEAN